MPSTSEKRCERSDLFVSACAHCRDVPPSFADHDYEVSVVIGANYAGRCQGCGQSYDVGAMIGRSEEAGWVLMECCGSVRH